MAQASHLRFFATAALLNWPQAGKPAETISTVVKPPYAARLAWHFFFSAGAEKFARLNDMSGQPRNLFVPGLRTPDPRQRAGPLDSTPVTSRTRLDDLPGST